MLNNYHDESRPSRVTVAFRNTVRFLGFLFLLKDAYVSKIANRLDRLVELALREPMRTPRSTFRRRCGSEVRPEKPNARN